MKKTLNVGLIGFGMIGKAHAYGLATLPFFAPGLTVAPRIFGVATSRAETAEAARRTLGCELATTDGTALIENSAVDVVHICAPNAEHLPALLDAIRCGKPIYCEKPVVATAAEAATVRAALAKSGYDAPTQVAFHLRGFAAVRRAKELIASGRLGRLVRYRVGYYHAGALDASAPFRWKHAVCGGTILDLASHLLDLLDYLVGLPAELTATATTLWPTRPVRAIRPGESAADVPTRPVEAEDSVAILTRGLLRPADDVAASDPRDPAALTGVVEATKLAAGAEDEMTFEIGGTRGAVRFSLMEPHYLEFFDATKPSGANGGESGWTRIASGARYEAPECDFPSAKSTTGWLRAHVASLATFYRSFGADGGSFGPDLAQGLRIQDALAVVKRSVESRSWETL